MNSVVVGAKDDRSQTKQSVNVITMKKKLLSMNKHGSYIKF